MTTISTKIPNTIFLQAKSIAESEDMTFDQFIAMALASQISSWNVGKTFEEHSKSGSWEKSLGILAKVPDVEPDEFDSL